MEICVIHGSNRKGNTDRTIEIIKAQLDSLETMSYSDVYLPKDLPYFCNGCFTCLNTGEYGGQNCPHKEFTHPIMEKMLRSDGIIIASPSYALAETAQVKALFDHFACNYITHRPYEEMFEKIGLVVSTAAGAGTKRTISTISRNMLFWGIKQIVKCGINIWVKDWDDMAPKKRSKLEGLLKRKANRFYKLIKRRNKIIFSTVIVLRFVFKKMINGYQDTETDKIYWKSKGWL